MLQGSKYALRVPIGTKENLETFADSLAVKFYHDWYRPELMRVIAVGDFDPAQMETSIKQRFASIKGPATPRAREYAAVPDHDQTLVSIETDKEYPLASVGLLWLKPRDSVHTIADFRRTLVKSLYDGMVNARFSEISQRADAPFAFAQGGHGALVRTKDAYQLFAGVKESGFEKAAEAVLAEAERISRFGFTQTELDRQRADVLRSMEQQFAEREKTNSSRYVEEYVSSALWDTPIMGIEQQQPLTKSLAPTITLAEVDALSKSSFGDKDRVVLVAAAEKPDVHVPTAATMLGAFAAAAAAPDSPGVFRARPADLAHRIRGFVLGRGARPGPSGTRQDRGRALSSGDRDHRMDAVERREGAAQADGLQGRRGALRGALGRR